MPWPRISCAGEDFNPSPMAMSNQKVDGIKIKIWRANVDPNFGTKYLTGQALDDV
jgi:hypothetical protein